MFLQVLFVVADELLKVHEGAGVGLTVETGVGKGVLGYAVYEGVH